MAYIPDETGARQLAGHARERTGGGCRHAGPRGQRGTLHCVKLRQLRYGIPDKCMFFFFTFYRNVSEPKILVPKFHLGFFFFIWFCFPFYGFVFPWISPE